MFRPWLYTWILTMVGSWLYTGILTMFGLWFSRESWSWLGHGYTLYLDHVWVMVIRMNLGHGWVMVIHMNLGLLLDTCTVSADLLLGPSNLTLLINWGLITRVCLLGVYKWDFYPSKPLPTESKPEVKQISKASSQPPLPPAVPSQLQVENISPALTPSQPQTHAQVTKATEPPRLVQSVDTSFSTTVPTNTKNIPQTNSMSSQQVAPISSYIYNSTPAYNTTAQNYALPASVHQSVVAPPTYQAPIDYGQGGMTSFQVPAQFQAQSYLPPTQNFGQMPQYPPAQHPSQSVPNFSVPPPLGLTTNTSMYPIPSSNLSTLQNPPSFGLPGHTGPPPPGPPSMPRPMARLPPPPLPPLHSRQPPPPHPGAPEATAEFQWPRGWMRWNLNIWISLWNFVLHLENISFFLMGVKLPL